MNVENAPETDLLIISPEFVGDSSMLMLAASEVDTTTLIGAMVATAFLIVTLFVVIIVLATRYYKRCPSNRILVVFGKTPHGSDFQCIHGGAKFVVPLLQDYRWLSLDAIRVEITGPAATDELAEKLFLPNVFNIAVGTELDLMQHAAKRLLDLTTDEIRHRAEDAIVGRLDHTLAEQRSRPSEDGPAVIDSLNQAVEAEIRQFGLVLLNSRRV